MKTMLIVLFSILLGVSLLGCANPWEYIKDEGTVEGTVKYSDQNQTPAADATVEVKTEFGTYFYGTTNATGYYKITEIPAGNATVQAYKGGWVSNLKNITILPGQITKVDLLLY